MNSIRTIKEFEKIKNQIIDSTLLIGLCTGFLAFLVAYFPFGMKTLERPIFYSDVVSISLLITVYSYRKKIKISIKASIVLVVLMALIISDSLVWGIYSMNKIMIVIIPFYSLFVFKFRTAILIYFMAILSYLSIGYFEWYEDHDPSFFMNRLASFSDWIEGGILLTTAALVIVIFTRNYNNALTELIEDLEQKNANLNKTLDDLKTKNEKLADYTFINSHLVRAPLARMLGLAELVSKDIKLEQHQELMQNFKSSANELDEIVAQINDSLENQIESEDGNKS